MAGLFLQTDSLDVSAAASPGAVMAVVAAPSDQKIRVGFKLSGKGTSTTGAHITFRITRGSLNSTGTDGESQTLNKRNSQDGETPRSAVISGYTSDPTQTSPVLLDSITIHPQASNVPTSQYQLNENETVFVTAICSTSTAASVQVFIEE